jgi:hypothetical protein
MSSQSRLFVRPALRRLNVGIFDQLGNIYNHLRKLVGIARVLGPLVIYKMIPNLGGLRNIPPIRIKQEEFTVRVNGRLGIIRPN